MLCDKIGWAQLEVAESLGDEMSELAEWESFYVIVGTFAGALIGLPFVVMTLIADMPPLRVAAAGAFATPASQSSRTGYFMFCCLWRRTQYSVWAHFREVPRAAIQSKLEYQFQRGDEHE